MASQIARRPERTEDVVRGTHEQSSAERIPGFRDAELRLRGTALVQARNQAEIGPPHSGCAGSGADPRTRQSAASPWSAAPGSARSPVAAPRGARARRAARTPRRNSAAAGPRRFDHAAHMIDQLRPDLHHLIPRANELQVLLGHGGAMLDGMQQADVGSPPGRMGADLEDHPAARARGEVALHPARRRRDGLLCAALPRVVDFVHATRPIAEIQSDRYVSLQRLQRPRHGRPPVSGFTPDQRSS